MNRWTAKRLGLSPDGTTQAKRRAPANRRLLFLAFVPLCLVARAAGATDAARDEMQRSLSAGVMTSPFDPGDIRKAQAYAEQAKREGIVPVAQPPTYWVPGWTCSNLSQHPGYAYRDYRNCIYYHHYHGRHWR